jgi:Zn finger protein HypA/HybF involved in hydrogenase expression
MLVAIGVAWLALAIIIIVMIERSPLECPDCGGYSPPREWHARAWTCPHCADHRKHASGSRP